jgi:DNA-directed RNA polymerase subunit M/transcription elongation factor TFIIS
MTVTCPKCSKSLKVKDEFAGKMLKCPGCGSTFKAGGAKPASATTAKIQPKPGEKQKKDKAGVAINWGPIIMIALASLIPIAIILFLVGPMRVKRHWDANQEKVDGDVHDVIDYALKCQASSSGFWNPRKGTSPAPSVSDVRFLPNIFTMSTPPTVDFDGFSSNGSFKGTYTFETGEVNVDMKIEGLTLAGGIHFGEGGTSIAGGGRSGDTSKVAPSALAKLKGRADKAEFHITGRVKGGNPVAEIDGKKAEIYWPPEVDEDGNPITPPEPATPAKPPKPTTKPAKP